jgi:hypothetical protein
VVALLVPVVILLGLTDWLIHLDALVRATALCALAGLGAWLLGKYVLRPLLVRFADLDIALKIEQRWPGLNDRVASTVQFLHLSKDDDRYGSAALRAATVRQTLEETEAIDFREVIEPRPVQHAAGLAALALFVAGTLFAASPELSRIGLRRLFVPYGSDRWPQQTHLSLIDAETPRKVARGDAFTLAVAIGVGERMPATARATYYYDDGATETELLRAVASGIFRGRIESVQRPFRFSVAAGDDTTSIRDVAVKVVSPPTLTDLTVRLLAPPYTRLEPETMAPGRTQIRAVIGTQIEVQAAANKPIAHAELHLGEKVASAPVAINATATGLKTVFTVTESVPFWFELLDTEGFASREAVRYELRAFADEAPRVIIEEPAHDRDVPARALVPVVFSVNDDFGIQSARILYKVASAGSEPTQDVALPLWEAPQSETGTARPAPIKRQEVRYDWNLEPLNLAPGSVVTFHAEALDFDNLKGPNLGRSREIRLRVLSDEDILRELDDARREIRDETARILAMQKQALTPVQDALRTIAQTEKTDAVNGDELRNAGMVQRQVSSRINNASDGLDQKIRRFLADLRNFRIPNPDAEKQMEQMQAGVEQIRQQHLGPAEQGLTRATKSLEEGLDQNGQPRAPMKPAPPAPGTNRRDSGEARKGEATKAESGEGGSTRPEPAKPEASPPKGSAEPTQLALREAETNQKAIAEGLERMLENLSEFETYRGVVKDAQSLLRGQEQAMKQAADTASKPDLMGKTPEALTPEQKADLANLGSRQNNLGKELQDLQAKMDEMAKRLDESDPLAAAALREAAQESRRQGTSAKMGEAADQLERNQMGAARNNQEQARQDLKDLVDAIQNRRERELARLVKELKNAEAELDKLRQRQAENLRKTREARNNPDARQRADQLKKLAKEQAEIQKELDRQLKRLAKLNAGGATRAGSRASGRMGQAQQDLDQDQGEQAEQDEDEALTDLEEAQDEVQQARRDAEEQLAMEQLVKMADHLKSLRERQETIVKATDEYEKIRGEHDGLLTIAQRNGIRSLGRIQEGLKDETAELIEKLEGAPVFALTLKRAAGNMEEAAGRLHTVKTDELTQRATRSAARRIQQLLESLKPDRPKEGDQQQGGGNPGGGAGGQGGDGIPPEAQIKMLKALQEEINERTDYYDELRRRKKELTPEQYAEIDRLQADQGTLADLARDLTRPKKDDGED